MTKNFCHGICACGTLYGFGYYLALLCYCNVHLLFAPATSIMLLKAGQTRQRYIHNAEKHCYRPQRHKLLVPKLKFAPRLWILLTEAPAVRHGCHAMLLFQQWPTVCSIVCHVRPILFPWNSKNHQTPSFTAPSAEESQCPRFRSHAQNIAPWAEWAHFAPTLAMAQRPILSPHRTNIDLIRQRESIQANPF